MYEKILVLLKLISGLLCACDAAVLVAILAVTREEYRHGIALKKRKQGDIVLISRSSVTGYFLPTIFHSKCHSPGTPSFESIMVYFELMGWRKWKSKLCNVIREDISLCRGINYSSHTCTLGNEEEEWSKSGGSACRVARNKKRTEYKTHPVFVKMCVHLPIMLHRS